MGVPGRGNLHGFEQDSTIELMPFSEVIKQPPMVPQNGTHESQGKIPFLGGIVLDALLDIDPWVFYIILGESDSDSSPALVLCAHRSCLEAWPCLACVGTAVLITNATFLWILFESNSIFRYIRSHVFHAARVILASSSAERLGEADALNTRPSDQFPSMTPMLVVTHINIKHAHGSKMLQSASSRESRPVERNDNNVFPTDDIDGYLSKKQRTLPHEENMATHDLENTEDVMLSGNEAVWKDNSPIAPVLTTLTDSGLSKENASPNSRDLNDESAPWGEYLDF